jgi:hypothetical protein
MQKFIDGPGEGFGNSMESTVLDGAEDVCDPCYQCQWKLLLWMRVLTCRTFDCRQPKESPNASSPRI